jgi:hypothetical protein
MIKLVGVPKRRAGWSAEEFYAHYYERHGPLSATVREFGKYAHQYTQNYALLRDMDPPLPNHALDRDGITELWFDDLDALIAAYREPDYLSVLRTDEKRFVDLDDIMVAIVQEHPLFEAAIEVEPDKAWAYRRRFHLFAFRAVRAGEALADFQKKWLAAAEEIRASVPFARYARRYVQSHVIEADAGLPGECVFGAIDEFTFDSIDDAVAFWRGYCATDALKKLDDQLTDSAGLKLFFGRSHVVFGAL